MTIGSYTKDGRKTVSVVSGGATVNVLIGTVLTKSWNGADWGPKGPPSMQKRPFSLVQEPLAPVNASYPKVRGRTGRPPKRTYITDNPYTMSSSFLAHTLCETRRYNSANFTRAASVSFGARANFSPPVWGSNDQIKLIGKLSDKIAGSDFNLGVFLGEGREALSMIASSATRVYTALKSLKRGDIPNMYRALTGSARGRRYDKFRQDGYLSYDDFELRELRRNQKLAFLDKRQSYDRDLSSLWLEAQYGWKPLLQDIHGAAAYVAERLERSPERVVRVRSRLQKDYTPSSQSYTTVQLLNGRSVVSKQIIARIKSENTVALTGLMDVSSVAWELLPWSFVIDWALPIGSYLKARNFAGKVNATYVVTTYTRNSWNGARYIQPGYVMSGAWGEALESNVTVKREILTSLPVPMPVFKPLSEVASWLRAGNALALLDQLRPRS